MLGKFAGVLVALPIAFVGCGGRVELDVDPNSGGTAGTGGTKPSGGMHSTGGAPIAGMPGSGGALAGGAPGVGAAPSLGGFTGVGGAGKGGAPNVGGSPNLGGAPPGGAPGVGGATGVGGSGKGGFVGAGGFPNYGGSPNTGGVPNYGGSPNTGGVPNYGGSPNTGGTTSVCPPCKGYQPGACAWEYCDTSSRKCVLYTLDSGQACDDHDFCTVGETCRGGVCQGGTQNTCGYELDGCKTVTCDPRGFCNWSTSAPNGSACKRTDLCELPGYCSAGSCITARKDCSGTTLPGQCYDAECNSSTGQCEPVPISGPLCKIPGDLCSDISYCENGSCLAASTKDCSAFNTQCSYGDCDASTGACVQHNYANGSWCSLSACGQNDFCSGGVCTPGTQIVSCINGDGCCPSNCTARTDSDCAYSITLDEMNRGWWNSTGAHDSANDNTYTGALSQLYNSYLTFDLRGVTQPIQSAELDLELESYYGGDPWEQISLWDVSTDATTLEASGSGNTRVFNDLQSGNSYATVVMYRASVGTTYTIGLGPAAIADINAARDGFFSIGLHVDTLSANPPSSGEGVRFSELSEYRVMQLVLNNGF